MTDNKYYPEKIEAKWQKEWEAKKLFSPDIKNAKNPYYNLMMFPYPSAEGLHVGNMYAFTGADVYAKFNRMQGKDVLEPIGLDGFGIHSENYALKVGRHPQEQAQIAEKNFYRQLRSIGNSFDWQRTVETYDPNYYKWTQWLFIQLFKAGLAYRKTALVNWCPKDLTVLSDEQVIDGSCERCNSKVEKRDLEQWFFRITNYADKLLNNIEGLNWTEKVKIAQRNWIGKSEGAEVGFKIQGQEEGIKVFTTRPDTLYGATFMVIAPEHKIVERILSKDIQVSENELKDIKVYVEKAKDRTEAERTAEGKDKTGVASGIYAINPVNGKEIPVWIADYVLSGYGTGAIMAVPAHDTRDFEFAKKFGLEIIEVIQPTGPVVVPSPADNPQSQELPAGARRGSPSSSHPLEQAYIGSGKLINSGDWDGIEVPKEMDKVLASLEAKNLGTKRANYHLRDWLISRQRYWGPPIPMIFCESCKKAGKGEVEGMPGWYTVSEKDLPVMLPDVADWKPMGTGKSPLANHPEFFKTTCPSCEAEAVRETDVSDTFLDSAWYFLRYPSTDVENAAFDTEVTRKWLPVHQYIGGAEHSVLHLLYSRFVTQVLNDLKFIDFDEPFTNFFAHGLIIKDGAKMSKSKGNVVVPDEYISKYGADTLRTYLMFIGPYSDGGDFRDSGIEGMNKFLRKVWKVLVEKTDDNGKLSPERLRFMHKTIQKVTKDISSFSYNTAIASLMEWYNYLNSELKVENGKLNKEEKEVYLQLLAPFAPHFTEELWQKSGYSVQGTGFSSIHLSIWPQFDEKYLVSEKIVIPVQVQGKRRGEIEISNQDVNNNDLVEKMAKEAVSKQLEGFEVKKVIYVPGKIINLVI